MEFHDLWGLLLDAAPVMLRGAGTTLLLAVAAMAGGLLLGLPAALLRIAPWAPLRWPAALYVSVFRGTPLLVQLFVVYVCARSFRSVNASAEPTGPDKPKKSDAIGRSRLRIQPIADLPGPRTCSNRGLQVSRFSNYDLFNP